MEDLGHWTYALGVGLELGRIQTRIESEITGWRRPFIRYSTGVRRRRQGRRDLLVVSTSNHAIR